ncbi:unnamed protein product [Polarella glacialis]|uniref:Tyrosyl-DNA phosphodiesterase 1 n=1 Tax=Polarella glacialis TaxID=89957 RepID=A0A813HE71_POLGL|nr:unnamed protein product [Polarella glacialis]CAE8635902.1 unnamed protein product [Polarella glacialis]
MIDLAWLLMECPSLLRVPRLTVIQGDGGSGCASGMALRSEVGLPTRVMAPFRPPLEWGTHHSKLALILYDDCIRVVVRTYNDVFSDFHGKSQAIFLQDFPTGAPAFAGYSDDFGAEFARYLKLYLIVCGGLELEKMDRYDFSAATGALVASVPGYHRGASVCEWGHMRLRRLLAQHVVLPTCWPSGSEEGLICQFSSLGSLSPNWLKEFQETLATTTGPPSSPTPPLQLVVPTVAQVRDSDEGWVAGVSVPIRKANLKEFLAPYWRRWGPSSSADRSAEVVRARQAMPHVKSYCRYAARRPGRPAAQMDPTRQGVRLAWICVTSHNLSKAAWGELQKGGSQICMRSYELGVVLFPNRLAALERDPQRPSGYFFRPLATPSTGGAGGVVASVFVPLPASSHGNAAAGEPCGYREVPICCPTEVPPADPPSGLDDDRLWAVDLEEGAYLGFDRFGSRWNERGKQFYGNEPALKQTETL